MPDEIKKFGLELREIFSKYLVKKESNGFHPHVTLIRMGERLPEHKQIDVPSWFKLNEYLPMHHVIDTVDLIESLSNTDEYKILKSFKLQNSL